MNTYEERTRLLREMMEENGWDAVVMSGSDPHSSEYPADRWKQVEWLCGFTGEAGDVVVTADHAGLWTDTRYFIQANEQLAGTGFELHKMRVPGAVGIPQWLSEFASEFEHPLVVALDGLCWSADKAEEIDNAVRTASEGSGVVSVPDLLGRLWQDRPPMPHSPIRTLDPEVSGVSDRFGKLNWLRKWMLAEDVDYVLLTSLDEIAWLLNVRANDIEYNPFVLSCLIVSDDGARWFVRKQDVDYEDDIETSDSLNELAADGVLSEDYDAVEAALAELPSGASLFIDPSTLNYHLSAFLEDCGLTLIKGRSPVILKKAVKEDSEIAVLRETYIADGVAMEKFLYWLENAVAGGSLTEWDASRKLMSFRAEIPDYRGDSFECISAYGPSAALPHYVTPPVGSRRIEPRGLYLVDSGGQYLTGTTDITRTVPLGLCSDEEKLDYTLVLKAMIDLSLAVFPEGTAGCQIDALAREALWAHHRNFGHGTGHGVGFYLGVHEGPQDIRQNFNPQALLPGMVTSNEPGLYREGRHGIRHENIVLVTEDRRPGEDGVLSNENEFGRWLRFDTLTCCHIDTSAVLTEHLSKSEIDWLDSYNAWVYDTLSSRLTPEESRWLAAKTRRLKTER